LTQVKTRYMCENVYLKNISIILDKICFNEVKTAIHQLIKSKRKGVYNINSRVINYTGHQPPNLAIGYVAMKYTPICLMSYLGRFCIPYR
jgi:hypothetical protein